MVNAVLTQPPEQGDDTTALARKLVEREDGLAAVGGFSLVFGNIGDPLAVISNRTPNMQSVTWIAGSRGETIGLSNGLITDRSWPKVTTGEQLLASAIHKDQTMGQPQENFVEDLFQILGADQLPKRPTDGKEAAWEIYVRELRKSIFIPVVGGEGLDGQDLASAQSSQSVELESSSTGDGLSGLYGTQKQTIILVNRSRHVLFIERTLFEVSARLVGSQTERRFEFDIDE